MVSTERMRLQVVGLALLSLLGVTVASPAGARADDPIEIVVEATKVSPEVLRAAIDRTVVFRNRSGRRSATPTKATSTVSSRSDRISATSESSPSVMASGSWASALTAEGR